MLAIIPIFAGLLACMPVPIGNPESSRIDPDISGVWTQDLDGDFDALYLYQPYDKRTWLIFGAMVEEGPAYEGDPLEIETTEDALKALENHDVGDDGITAPTTIAIKAWVTKLGGKVFMTWEPVGGFNADGSYTPEMWYVFRVEKIGKDQVELYLVDGEHEAFDDILKPDDYEGDDYAKDMRRKWENALKKVAKNVDDDDLYSDAYTLRRLPEKQMAKASELFREVVEFD